ncbi:MAG: hypothetical protein C4582_01760 [Desulfobacteraceae bacterium]|nr:MAG: hypothetical protein C4582_01760 [Desulfobacteraceae bacterium]
MKECNPAVPFNAAITLPGSKSITHRALIAAALAEGKTIISRHRRRFGKKLTSQISIAALQVVIGGIVLHQRTNICSPGILRLVQNGTRLVYGTDITVVGNRLKHLLQLVPAILFHRG